MRKVSDKNVEDIKKTHFGFNKVFFFFENHFVYEKTWKIAWWIRKATTAHTQYM